MAAHVPAFSDAHPNDDLLLALHDGTLFPGDKPVVEGHLNDCSRCRARLIALTEPLTPATPSTAPAATRTAAAPPASGAAAVPRPPVPTPPSHVPRTQPSVTAAVLKRLALVLAIFGIGGLTIFVRSELSRRSDEPVSLPTTPSAPVPALAPAPTVEEIPVPPPPEPDTVPADPVPADPVPNAAPPPLPGQIVLTAPDRRFLWRVTGAKVERSTDSGMEWRVQEVALTQPMTAGVAPSAAVCWLVGKNGSIFVGLGAVWHDVSLSEQDRVDLVKVSATDSMKATVTTADGHHFTTSDTGTSWMRVEQ